MCTRPVLLVHVLNNVNFCTLYVQRGAEISSPEGKRGTSFRGITGVNWWERQTRENKDDHWKKASYFNMVHQYFCVDGSHFSSQKQHFLTRLFDNSANVYHTFFTHTHMHVHVTCFLTLGKGICSSKSLFKCLSLSILIIYTCEGPILFIAHF